LAWACAALQTDEDRKDAETRAAKTKPNDRVFLPNQVRTIKDSTVVGFHPAENGWVERAAAEKRTKAPEEHQGADQQAAFILLRQRPARTGC
jgi:hypothetical protein